MRVRIIHDVISQHYYVEYKETWYGDWTHASRHSYSLYPNTNPKYRKEDSIEEALKSAEASYKRILSNVIVKDSKYDDKKETK